MQNGSMIVSLTFDDGWKSQFTNAKPILDKYGFKATFYIIANSLYQDISCYMTHPEVIQLSREGHEIGAHSITHADLTLGNEEEIRQSKLDLTAYGFDVKSFAYPYAAHNAELWKLAECSGFENARAGSNKPISKSSLNRYAVEAFFIENHTTIDEVKEWFEESTTELLVLALHQVEKKCGRWGCEPEMLEQICEYIHTNDNIIKVMPISDLLMHI
jgi:peptidoglycan/xylan/chitin deacetylase (PgdA/CDA1 family)